MRTAKEEKDYSPFQLMSEFKICFPIIQREYIQGFDNERICQDSDNERICQDSDNERICQGFDNERICQGSDYERICNTTKKMLEDILEALENERDRVNLNIIYGYSENGVFYPVDGQQRLTLLYLIIYYCAIMGEKFEDFSSEIQGFSYETKESAKSFFESMIIKQSEIKEFLEDGKDAIEKIKSCLWFRADWNNDTTINSVLEVLNELGKTIEKDKAKDYYQKLKNGQSVTLDVCIDEKERAKLNSGISYISLNARGKMLEDFENAKSLLEKIEIKLGGKEGFFSEQYDRKYLDVFYKSVDSSKKLEDKAKEINQKSVSFLLNSYNLVCNVFGENTSRNYVKNFDDYYKNLNDFYKNYERNEEDCGIMKIYFSFIHKVLTEMHNITGVDEWACLNHIWKDEKKGLFNTCEKEEQDSECTVIYLLYLYFNENVSIESLRKLEYVLNNISYDSVRQSNFDFARYICERLVKDDIYEYFVKVVNIQDSIKEIKWKNKNNDLKCKIKEQIIKFQMIDCYNKDAYEPKKGFKAYEDKNGRQLYYLLLITDLWSGEITKEKINLLDTYLTRYQNSLFLSDLLMKKWFAFATYYDDEKDELLSAQEINERCNYRYFRNEGESKIQLSTKNLHKLEWNLYYTDDEIEYGSDIKTKELKKIKLFIIKKMYDFLLELNTKEKIHEWLKSKFKESYNQCWLKYAVDRGYSELLDNQLRYNNGNVEILIKDEEREESWVRFDARVLLLDLKENRGLEQYDKFVWSYDTKHVKDSKLEIGLPYKECINQKFYNHFPVPIFNLLYEEKYLEGRRCFFYLMDRVNLVFPNNIVYSIENEEIKLYQFYSNYKYEIFSYSLSGDFKRLEDEQKDFEKKVANLPKRFQDFEKNSNNWEKDYYSYLDGIYKFRKKPIIEKKIEMKNFQKKGENNLYDLGFRHEVFSTRGLV